MSAASSSKCALALVVLALGGCTGGFGTPGDGDVGDFIDDIPPEDLACPADPDCAIGGDCALYECPDHWICQERDDGERRCVSPGPDYPDGGDWTCEDVDGRTECTGRDFPDGGGGDGWSCEMVGDLVRCVHETPDYPDGGGGSGWSCWYEGDLRVCSTIPGEGGDGGGWTCWDDETGRHCRRDRDLPGDGGGWTCFDYEGVTHCDGGGDHPDGGGEWACEERGGEYYCVDRTPDYPDGGGGGHWSCRFTREFRVCDWHDGGGDGGIPRTECSDDRRGAVSFLDELDGDPDGELAVRGDDPARSEACATVRVMETGYYTLYDDALAESCAEQVDEIGYVTITNSCNSDGNPVERNTSDRFVIADMDNVGRCSEDAECGAGSSCITRSAHFGPCCVPTAPALVGTFLLLAGEDNRICLHHACPEIRAGTLRGADEFVTGGCEGSVNSVHLRLDGAAFICPDPSLEFPLACGT